jgi:ribosomal protein L37E
MDQDQTSAEDRLVELILDFVKKLVSQTRCPRCGATGATDLEYHWHDQAWVNTQYYRSAETARSIPSFDQESEQPHVHFSCRRCGSDWLTNDNEKPLKTLLAEPIRTLLDEPINAPIRWLLSDGQPPTGTLTAVEEAAQRWQIAGVEIIGLQIGPLPPPEIYRKPKRVFRGGI